MNQAIRDPHIPYIGTVEGRFTPGKLIRIQGAPPGVAYRFDINLQCGPQIVPRDDIAIQISVRILDGFIAMNSLQNSVWGDVLQGHSQPVKRAEPFELLILCDFNKYKIVINGQLFYDFPQRIHYDRISHLTIDGDVSISEILYASQDSAPALSSFARPAPALRQTENDFSNANRSDIDSSLPPSYFDVVQNYPSNGQSHPYPVKGAPNLHPSGPMIPPYPTSTSSYPSPSAPTMTLPAAIPLNAASSNFRPVPKSNRKKYCGYFWSIVIGVFIIVIVIVTKTTKRGTVEETKPHYSTYSNSQSSNYIVSRNYDGWR